MKIIFDNTIENRRLVIREHKRYLYGVITNSYDNSKMSAKFYFKDGDATIYRVREYFNFWLIITE